MATAVTTDDNDITLKDVIVHMNHMEQRLTGEIKQVDLRLSGVEQSLTTRIDRLDAGLSSVNGRLDVLERNLTNRMDALDEDLTATIKDTLKIRRHVGMPVSEEA